ncbi:autophagy protein 5 [Umbelopsis sp. WA50703]
MSSNIAKSVWNGRIPLSITVNEDDAIYFGANETPAPILFELPRTSYLTVLTEEARDAFVAVGLNILEAASEIWFEYQGIPLKWHYPIGLLYDTLCIAESSLNQKSDSKPIPWSITIHFRNYPSTSLFRDQSIATTRDFYMSMIKEADFLRHGSTKKVMNLSKSDQTQLWDSLCSNDYDSFWKVNQRLVSNEGQSIRHIPLRLYLPGDCPVIQERVNPRNEEGESLSVREIIQQLLPNLKLDTPEHELSALCHGVAIPLDTPVIWASLNLAYPDNFLHITLF